MTSVTGSTIGSRAGGIVGAGAGIVGVGVGTGVGGVGIGAGTGLGAGAGAGVPLSAGGAGAAAVSVVGAGVAEKAPEADEEPKAPAPTPGTRAISCCSRLAAGRDRGSSTVAEAGVADVEPGLRPGPSPTRPEVPSCTPRATTPRDATAAAAAATRRIDEGEERRGSDIPPLTLRVRDETDHGSDGLFDGDPNGLVIAPADRPAPPRRP